MGATCVSVFKLVYLTYQSRSPIHRPSIYEHRIPQEAGHDALHFCTDPLMATLAHFDTDQVR